MIRKSLATAAICLLAAPAMAQLQQGHSASMTTPTVAERALKALLQRERETVDAEVPIVLSHEDQIAAQASTIADLTKERDGLTKTRDEQATKIKELTDGQADAQRTASTYHDQVTLQTKTIAEMTRARDEMVVTIKKLASELAVAKKGEAPK